MLYVAIDEWKSLPIVGGRLKRTGLESIAMFTPIIATTSPGGLQPALRSRLNRIEFSHYSERELTAIAKQTAARGGIKMTAQGARKLAEVAQGSPRRISQRLENLRLFWPRATRFTADHVRFLLKREGVDDRGFLASQRLYLATLANSPGGSCSLKRLSISLGCDLAGIQEDVEPFLIDRGFVEVSGKGRRLTQEGRNFSRTNTPATLEATEVPP
jgi:Holliday junction DNA helicase RuvB